MKIRFCPDVGRVNYPQSVNGKTFPLVGRISMDQCCVNLCTDNIDNLPVKRWDEAIIFGGFKQDAMYLADIVGTIPYEITCNINMRVPRVYETA